MMNINTVLSQLSSLLKQHQATNSGSNKTFSFGHSKGDIFKNSSSTDISKLVQIMNCLPQPPVEECPPVEVPPPPPPVDCPPEPPPPVNANATGMIVGDPHFTGFNGSVYDVQGQKGKTYNVLTDSNVVVNDKFKAAQKGKTLVGATNIQVGTGDSGVTDILFKAGKKNSKKVPTINGQTLKKGSSVSFDTGLVDANGNAIMGTATYNGKTLTVDSGEYTIESTRNKGKKGKTRIDQKFTTTAAGTMSDGVAATGLLGLTGDGRAAANGTGSQGEGVIDGSVTDYEVANIGGNKNANGKKNKKKAGKK